MPSYSWHQVLFELHHMRMVCLLKAITPACVTNTSSLILKIDYTPYSDSFEILQAKVKCHLSVGPARSDPRALTKQYFARAGPISVYYAGLLRVNILGKFHDSRVN